MRRAVRVLPRWRRGRPSMRRVPTSAPSTRCARPCGVDDHAMFVFSREPGADGATVYSRMFAPGLGVAEDPATGAASGPLGCYLVRARRRARRRRPEAILSLQGVKMGRPELGAHRDRRRTRATSRASRSAAKPCWWARASWSYEQDDTLRSRSAPLQRGQPSPRLREARRARRDVRRRGRAALRRVGAQRRSRAAWWATSTAGTAAPTSCEPARLVRHLGDLHPGPRLRREVQVRGAREGRRARR